MAELRAVRHSGFIESDADIQQGIKALRRKCPHLRRAHDLAGDPPLRRREPGFEGLARIVVGQQLSVASAEAIWARTRLAISPMSAATLLALDDEPLRLAGLSRGKIVTLRAVSQAVVEGHLDLEGLGRGSPEALREALVAVRGIGPWTADIFEMFCVGRRDAFAPGDLALQVAVQMAMGLDARPSPDALTEIAERWRPWRGVAALLLWAYYKAAKDARSVVPV